MIAVTRAPTNRPRIGLENIVNRAVNSGTFASGFTAPLIMSIPVIRTMKPRRTAPRFFFCSFFFKNIVNTIPITARIGAKEDGFNIFIIKLPPSSPVKLSNQAVIVVPTLAPMIIPTACSSFMIPEFTKPTTITVVAEEDWITAVTPAPNNTAISLFAVSFSRIFSRRPPDAFSRPSPITSIPNRNSARPPSIVNTPKMSIISSICFFAYLAFYHTVLE